VKIHLNPVGLYSPAMMRIATALKAHAPSWVSFVENPSQANLRVLYVIGDDAVSGCEAIRAVGQKYVIVQCFPPGADTPEARAAFGDLDLIDTWRNAEFVWSYHDMSGLSRRHGFPFYHAPLGLDAEFMAELPLPQRSRKVITMGHVSGPLAEAIEEVWTAAQFEGVKGMHIGPGSVGGMRQPFSWRSTDGAITDEALSHEYGSAQWVAALRHLGGFELPAAEGLACGARPILFDQPDMRHWYGESAVYVPECSGDQLVGLLRTVFRGDYVPVTTQERRAARDRFSWRRIATGFWSTMITARDRSATEVA